MRRPTALGVFVCGFWLMPVVALVAWDWHWFLLMPLWFLLGLSASAQELYDQADAPVES